MTIRFLDLTRQHREIEAETKRGEALARPPVSGQFIHGAEQLHAALKFMLRSLVVRLLGDADR